MVDVSIVITSYKSKPFLEDCIDSVIGSIKKHSYEIIVVDDASNDGTEDVVRRKYPQIKYIKNPGNLGYVRSNNIGMRSAIGKYLLSLNNDTVVKDEAIDKLTEFMDKERTLGAVGPKLLNSDGTVQLQCRRGFPNPFNSLAYFFGLSRLFPKSRLFSSYLLTCLDDSSLAEVDSLCGAAMMIRREVIDKVGYMDESYVMYGDDIDWCYRIKQAGYKVYYLPDAEIIHFGGRGGSRKQSYRNIYEFHRAMAVFYHKHQSKKHIFLLNLLVYAGIWVKCSISLLLNIFRKDKYVGTKKP